MDHKDETLVHWKVPMDKKFLQLVADADEDEDDDDDDDDA